MYLPKHINIPATLLKGNMQIVVNNARNFIGRYLGTYRTYLGTYEVISLSQGSFNDELAGGPLNILQIRVCRHLSAVDRALQKMHPYWR